MLIDCQLMKCFTNESYVVVIYLLDLRQHYRAHTGVPGTQLHQATSPVIDYLHGTGLELYHAFPSSSVCRNSDSVNCSARAASK